MKWTLRKSGDIRTTIRVEYHVPKPMIEFLQTEADMTERRALAYVRDHIGQLVDGWRTIAVDDEREPYVTEDGDVAEQEGHAVYKGPVVG